MRLSLACTVTSAEVVGSLIVRDENLNMRTDPGRRQPPKPKCPCLWGWRRGGREGGVWFGLLGVGGRVSGIGGEMRDA
jgi:hypothetical protein